MIPAPRTTSIIVSGLVGDVEVLLDEPTHDAIKTCSSVKYVAVVCHPHPLYGGTMTNKVTHTLARACNELGAVAVRFNFRGVGKSAGTHDDGKGETDDVLAMVQWAAQRWPDASIWLAGFSFGAAMALRASLRVARTDHVVRLITVAPALRWLTQVSEAPLCPWLIVQGDQDELVDVQEVQKWATSLAQAPHVAILPGAEHFFHGRLNDLRDTVQSWLNTGAQQSSNV
jgi:alpha/beta superfamily hydrolase